MRLERLCRLEQELDESLRLLKAFFELHVDKIRGKVNIVISYEQRDEVSIFN